MPVRIYSNNCKNGDSHIGIATDKEALKYRELEENTFGDISSYVTVVFDDSTKLSWSAILKSVDEAFNKIGKPTYRDQYSEQTSTGRVELLAEPGLFETAASVKMELNNVIKVLRYKGEYISLK